MWYLIAAVALTTATSGDVSATRLDGTTVAGRIDAWQNDRLVLATTDGSRSIPVAQLLSVRLATAAPPAGGLRPVLATVDGSVIPVLGFRISGANAVATLDHPAGSTRQELHVSLRQVRAVRLMPLDADVTEQWLEIRRLSLPNDLLVVVKRGGKSLDYLEGVIGNITDDTIEFTFDGTRVDVPRAKVAGVVFYRPKPESAEPAPCVLVGRDELRLRAEAVRLNADVLHVVTTDGIELAWPLEQVLSADYSAGKVVFLSDLQPVAESWQPLIRLPAAATNMAAFGQPRIDRSGTGGTLSLWFPEEHFTEGLGTVQSYDKGVAIRSRTELVYRLPRGFGRFVAIAGIDPDTRASGNVVLSVFGDQRLLREATITGRDPPLPIELNVANVRRLKIIVDYGDNLDTGDWLNLCNARIVK